MIAVEFTDWDAPRGKDNKVVSRQGLLLQVTPTTRDPVNIAFVLTKAMRHDGKYRAGDGETIIMPVQLTSITVKGVSLPFEPMGSK